MVHKRPFDEVSNEVSAKQPRQHEVNTPIIVPLEFPCEGTCQSPNASRQIFACPYIEKG